jgi:hypothetical protein
MSQDRKQWAAISYPDQPKYLTPEAVSRRAKVRIGVRVALMTLPFVLAAGLGALASGGGGDGGTSPAVAAQLYPGDKIALSVRLELSSHGLLGKGMSVDCDGSAVTAGAVSACDEYSQSNGGGRVSFDVHFVDGHGAFSFALPGGPLIKGSLAS